MPNSNRLPDVLTEAEQESLLSQPNPRYPTGQRNYTLLRIMLDTGLRSSEVVSLKWEHVNLMSGKLMVKEGKGAKDRNLWLDADNIDLLCDWKERQMEEVAPDCEYIFTTLKGSPIKPRYLREMVSRYAIKSLLRSQGYPVPPDINSNTFANEDEAIGLGYGTEPHVDIVDEDSNSITNTDLEGTADAAKDWLENNNTIDGPGGVVIYGI